MTGYAFQRLDQAKAHREAQARVEAWTLEDVAGVAERFPQVAEDADHDQADWAVTVETQRRMWETPIMAAERVALWITLHAESHGRPPTQRAIQGNMVPEGERPTIPEQRRDRHSW